MIFILLFTIGMLLIIYSVLGLKKENKAFNNVLQERKENMNPLNTEIGELRREVGETLTEIQMDIIKLQEDIKNLKENKLYSEDEVIDEEIINNFQSNLKDNFIKKSNYNNQQQLSVCYNINKIKIKNTEKNKEVEEDMKIQELKEVADVEVEGNTRNERIRQLLKEGKSVDYICENFNMGKGEILLIRDLYTN